MSLEYVKIYGSSDRHQSYVGDLMTNTESQTFSLADLDWPRIAKIILHSLLSNSTGCDLSLATEKYYQTLKGQCAVYEGFQV